MDKQLRLYVLSENAGVIVNTKPPSGIPQQYTTHKQSQDHQNDKKLLQHRYSRSVQLEKHYIDNVFSTRVINE